MANYRYPLTNKIKIFPSSLRGLRVTTDGTEAIQGPADGKFTSESNIASIVTTIAGKESYIKEIKENGASKYIIVIHGYRFLLEDLIPHEYKYRDKEGIILTETWENVYANILVEKTSGRLVDCDTRTTLDYKDTSQLYSEDTVYLFRGLFFSGVSNQASLTNDDYDCYSLHVTHKKEDKNEWELVYDSTQYLDGAHIYGSVDNTKNVTSTINKVLITDIFNVADAEKGITTAEVNNATNVTKKIDLRYIDDSARPAESQDPSIFEDYTDALTNPTHTKNSTNVTKTIDGRPIDLLSAGEGNACIFETGTNQTHVKNATNVTTSINNKKIIDIFENDGLKVKNATTADNLSTKDIGEATKPIYFKDGVPVVCNNEIASCAASAKKLTVGTKGSTTLPVYFNDGNPDAVSTTDTIGIISKLAVNLSKAYGNTNRIVYFGPGGAPAEGITIWTGRDPGSNASAGDIWLSY